LVRVWVEAIKEYGPYQAAVLKGRRQAWLVLAVVFLASVAVTANRFKVPPVLPVLMTELHVDMVTGGWLMSVSSLAGAVLAIPTAFLLTRFGLKPMALVAMGCAVAGAVAGALATSATAMLLARIVEGISVALIAVVAPTTISLWFEPRERGVPMGIWAAWVPVGNVLMFNLAPPLADALGWRAVWWFGALSAGVALVLAGLVVREPANPGSPATAAPVPPGSFGRKAFTPSTWLLALAFGAFGFAVLGYNTWAPTFLNHTLAIGTAVASSYASLMFLAAIPANVAAGWAINRIKHRYALLPAAFAITTVLFFWSFRLGSAAAVVPYMIGLGFASNFVPTAMFTLAPETMAGVEYAGLALAIVLAGSNVGSLAGPPALASIVNGNDWIAGSLSLVAIMAVGTALSWFVARRH
jgi:MFS family permease